MVLLLPALWMLAGIPAMGWLRWLPPCVFGYAVILALGLRSRVRRSTLQLEREWLVQSVDTPKERRLALEWLQPGTGQQPAAAVLHGQQVAGPTAEKTTEHGRQQHGGHQQDRARIDQPLAGERDGFRWLQGSHRAARQQPVPCGKTRWILRR